MADKTKAPVLRSTPEEVSLRGRTAEGGLTFNGQPISDADAKAALTKIYGEKRVTSILAGLADGTYKCASVAGGHLEIAKASEA